MISSNLDESYYESKNTNIIMIFYKNLIKILIFYLEKCKTDAIFSPTDEDRRISEEGGAPILFDASVFFGRKRERIHFSPT